MQSFLNELYTNIISSGRWLLYLNGLKNTILITIGAAVIGTIIGCLVAICKVYAKDNKKLKPLDVICDVYLTVIRGTPMMVQLMIFAFIIFAAVSFDNMIYVAMLAFGVNSGAYVAELVRAGINAVDPGQMEAGRSLGLSKNKTMQLIIMPQAIKNILPGIANEAIVLLKETSIVGYAAIGDITYAASLIRSRTYSPIPLILIAVIYLGIVMLMTWGLRKLERRLAKSDKR